MISEFLAGAGASSYMDRREIVRSRKESRSRGILERKYHLLGEAVGFIADIVLADMVIHTEMNPLMRAGIYAFARVDLVSRMLSSMDKEHPAAEGIIGRMGRYLRDARTRP
jgi:hypothetical protein